MFWFVNYRGLSLLLSTFQSLYCFLTTILPKYAKEWARKMSSECSLFYAAIVKDLVRLKIKNSHECFRKKIIIMSVLKEI